MSSFFFLLLWGGTDNMSVQDPSRVKNRNDGGYSTVLLISRERGEKDKHFHNWRNPFLFSDPDCSHLFFMMFSKKVISLLSHNNKKVHKIKQLQFSRILCLNNLKNLQKFWHGLILRETVHVWDCIVCIKMDIRLNPVVPILRSINWNFPLWNGRIPQDTHTMVSTLRPDISNIASSAVVISRVTVAIQILSRAICNLSDGDRSIDTRNSFTTSRCPSSHQ